jgi:hypothetical protein
VIHAHRRRTYSRRARLLKQAMALLFAPTIGEGLGEGEVRMRLHGGSRLLIGGDLPRSFTRRADATPIARPTTRKVGS